MMFLAILLPGGLFYSTAPLIFLKFIDVENNKFIPSLYLHKMFERQCSSSWGAKIGKTLLFYSNQLIIFLQCSFVFKI